MTLLCSNFLCIKTSHQGEGLTKTQEISNFQFRKLLKLIRFTSPSHANKLRLPKEDCLVSKTVQPVHLPERHAERPRVPHTGLSFWRYNCRVFHAVSNHKKLTGSPIGTLQASVLCSVPGSLCGVKRHQCTSSQEEDHTSDLCAL